MMMKMTQAIHSRNFQVDDVKRRFQTPASVRPLRGSLSSCLKILMTRVLVEEYYESCTRLMTMTLSSLKQCSCGRNEDDGRQLTRQPQINVYYSTAVSCIRTKVRKFSANNTFYTSVGSETGLKKRIFIFFFQHLWSREQEIPIHQIHDGGLQLWLRERIDPNPLDE